MNNDTNHIDKKTLDQLTTHAEEELLQGHLSLSIDLVRNLMQSLGNLPWQTNMVTDVDYVEENYQLMLHYMEQGMDDPMRKKVYQRLVQKTHRALLDIRRTYDISTSVNVYSEWSHKLWKPDKHEDKPKIGFKGTDEQGFTRPDYAFNLVWTAPQLTPETEQEIRLMLTREDTTIIRFLLHALTLALMHYYDAAKLSILTDFALNPEQPDDVRASAAFGVAVALHLHHKVIPLYERLAERLSDRQTYTKEMLEMLTQIQYHVALYRDSERFHQKFEQEILPTLVKVTQQRMKLGFDDMSIDLTDPDEAPFISKKTRKKLMKNLQEWAQLFNDGMDVNLRTFTSLKNFPFFQQLPHWLAPFAVPEGAEWDLQMVNKLPLCDNDKYSVAMLLQHMPKEQREQMGAIMREQEENFDNIFRAGIDHCQNVVHTFYRCLKRSPWTGLWPDIYDSMMLTDTPIVGDALKGDANYLRKLSTMLMHNKNFELAEQHLQLLVQLEGSGLDMLKQRALCLQEMGKYSRAISLYQQALALAENDETILYRLQYCYAQTGKYDEQLNCLLALEKAHPDDAQMLTETGLCLMQLQRWEEAQKRFFKMEFQHVKEVPSQRAIAWCALRLKDYKLASQYYNLLLNLTDGQARWEDYLNAAHVAWLQNDIVQALPLYREYVHRYITANPETKNALVPFEQDVPILKEHGKTATDIALLHDLIGKSR